MASAFLIVSVFVFDIIAVGLAVAAERRRNTAVVQTNPQDKSTYCAYDSDIATGFGIGAFLFLLLSHIVVVFGTRCFCCGRALRPGGARSCAKILFIFSWLTFLIAEACLLAGSVHNAYHTRYRAVFGKSVTCQTLRKGVFATGAVFALATFIFSEIYYFCFDRANRTYDEAAGGRGPPLKESGVGMAAYR